MNRDSKKIFSKKIILILAAVVLLVSVGIFIYAKRQDRSTEVGVADKPGTEKVDLSPPTEEEKQATEQHKADLLKQEEARNQAPPAGGRTVTPIITNSGYYDNQVEVSSFVPGIYEDGGVCTATFTQGASKVVKQSKGLKDATTTRCTNFAIPRSDFPSSGNWTLVLSYASPAAHGASAAQTVEVK